jgi:hypothetical protein
MRRRNVQFKRVYPTRQYECRILGIHARGSAKDWALDLAGMLCLLVTWGFVCWILLGVDAT